MNNSIGLFLLLFVAPFFAVAQSSSKVISLEGTNFNPSDTVIQIYKGGLLKGEYVAIPLEKGTFSAVLPLDEGIQQIAVVTENFNVGFYGEQGDVIQLTGSGMADSITDIRGQTPARTSQLRFNVTHVPYQEVGTFWYDSVKVSNIDSVRYLLCWQRYAQQLDTLLAHRDEVGEQINLYINGYYFAYVDLLTRTRGTRDTLKIAAPDTALALQSVLPTGDYYKQQSKPLFLLSPEYRDYFFEAIRWTEDTLYNHYSRIYPPGSSKGFARTEYERGQYIENLYLRNWYQAKSILLSIHSYDYELAHDLGDTFLEQREGEPFTDLLKKQLIGYGDLKEGEMAPGFLLSNETGDSISLRSFNGQIVYLNFWGVHCGPCLSEFKFSFPKLQQKYPGVKIVTVCIDGTRDEWLAAIEKYNMDVYTNLYDPAYKVADQYKISSIPHNVWVDSSGNLFKYTAADPFDLPEVGKEIQAMYEQDSSSSLQ